MTTSSLCTVSGKPEESLRQNVGSAVKTARSVKKFVRTVERSNEIDVG